MELNKVNGKSPIIMQVLPNLEQGGVERGTVDVAKAILKAEGTSIVVSNGGLLANEIMMAKATHIQLPVHTKNPFKIISNSKKLAKLIEEYNVDIVHARSRAPAWSCYMACKKTNTKFITTFHAVYGHKGILKRLYNSSMIKGDRVIAISKHVKKHILDTYKVDPAKVDLVIRGTDMTKFNPDQVNEEKISEIINKWNIKEGNPIVLLPGRLSSYKGQETLINAAKILTDKGVKDVSYIILGSGGNEYSKSLHHKIVELGLEEDFYMINGTNEMPTAYTMSDIVLSLSAKPEGFGRIVTEAGAMGRPVIATALGGYLETVIDGVTGKFVGVNNAEDVAKAIEKYLKMSDKQKEVLGNKARKNVYENFSTEVMFRELFSTYNKVLKS